MSETNYRVFKLSRPAMGTIFECVLIGEVAAYLQSAAAEAMEEVERLDRQLSLFNPTSDLSRINALAARENVRVEPRLFRLLQRAEQLTRETDGAFDMAAAALKSCWGFVGGAGLLPSQDEIDEAQARVGMKYVVLDESERSIRFTKEGVGFDAGAIGKGWAIDRATDLLREKEITSALLHGGGSTVYAIGIPPDREGWRLGLSDPQDTGTRRGSLNLKDQALSTSSACFQFFEFEGRRFGHILDPRTGAPATGVLSATVVASSALETDALSTAFFVSGFEGARRYCELHPDIGAALFAEDGSMLSCGAITIR